MPIGSYFVDFVCREHKVIVEVDGGTHSTEQEIAYDDARTRFLEQSGFVVFRVHNVEIFENVDGVADTLLAFVHAKIESDASNSVEVEQVAAPHPDPLPVKYGERETIRN
jgi:very-short-patch-repair endonuclease